jgi:hypothetical protein
MRESFKIDAQTMDLLAARIPLPEKVASSPTFRLEAQPPENGPQPASLESANA